MCKKITITGLLLVIAFLLNSPSLYAQETEGKLGGWYAYVFNTRFTDSQWGMMGDF